MDCSPPGAPVHGILQARLLELVAASFSRGSSQPRDWTRVSWVTPACQEDSLPLSHLGSSWHDLKKQYALLTKIMLLPAFLSSQALALSISFNSMNYSICFQQILFSTWWVKPSFSCLHNWLKLVPGSGHGKNRLLAVEIAKVGRCKAVRVPRFSWESWSQFFFLKFPIFTSTKKCPLLLNLVLININYLFKIQVKKKDTSTYTSKVFFCVAIWGIGRLGLLLGMPGRTFFFLTH